MLEHYLRAMDGLIDIQVGDDVARGEVVKWLVERKIQPATHALPMPARALNRRRQKTGAPQPFGAPALSLSPLPVGGTTAGQLSKPLCSHLSMTWLRPHRRVRRFPRRASECQPRDFQLQHLLLRRQSVRLVGDDGIHIV